MGTGVGCRGSRRYIGLPALGWTDGSTWGRESAVPEGNESALTVVRDDRDRPLVNPLDSSVDSVNDTVTVTITDPERLAELQGETMLVVQYEHYLETVRNRSSRPALRALRDR